MSGKKGEDMSHYSDDDTVDYSDGAEDTADDEEAEDEKDQKHSEDISFDKKITSKMVQLLFQSKPSPKLSTHTVPPTPPHRTPQRYGKKKH
eukprot:15345360-Ditylum_brightwellii.AAC.1